MADFFGLKHGEIAIVRLLEQGADLAYASLHKIPVSNRRYPVDQLCLDQDDQGVPCPYCASPEKEIRSRRTVGFINVLWRGSEAYQQYNQQLQAQNAQLMAAGQAPYMLYTLAPTYKRSQNNIPVRDDQTKQKIVTGYADGVFLWKCSKKVYDLLVQMDQTYRGLMSRDFTVRRHGSTMEDTTYFVDPFDVNRGEVPMSPVDIALANTKYDLDKFITPPSFEEAAKTLGGAGASQADGQFVRGAGVAVPPPPQVSSAIAGLPPGVNPFAAGQAMPASQPPIPAPPPPPVVQ